VVLAALHEVNISELVFQNVVVFLRQATMLRNGISDAPRVHLPILLALVRMLLQHDSVGREFRHDMKRGGRHGQRGEKQHEQGDHLNGVVARRNLPRVDSHIAGDRGFHALESAALEGENRCSIGRGGLGKDGERREVDASVFNRTLSLDDGLYDLITLFNCATSLDVKRLKAFRQLVQNWHISGLDAGCEAGLDGAGDEGENIEPTSVVADDSRNVARSTFGHSRVSFWGLLTASLFFYSAKIFFIVAHCVHAESFIL